MENKKFIQNQSNVGAYRGTPLKLHIAVLLVNFGGPDRLSSVKSFLYNLFADPTVLNFPFANLYRKPLAWFISNIRQRASGEMYKKIGGISSLIPLTYLQAGKLQQLFNRNNLLVDVFIGFRYCRPFIEEVLNEIKNIGYKKIIILPLYPQYSYTTTGSVQLVVDEWLRKRNDVKLHFIKEWYKDEDYIEAYAGLITRALENLDLRSCEIIFSAHSIPVFNIKNGDPYEKQITETCKLIIKKLNWKKRWHIGYQSKLGPVKWLEPGTDKVIEEIATRNKNANVLVVPISFVCEHVETIYEIGFLYKEVAKRCGIKKFARVPALNTDKYLIQALYNQVVSCLEDNQVNIKELLFTK